MVYAGQLHSKRELYGYVAGRVERRLTTVGYGAEEEVYVDDTDTMVVLQEAFAAH